MKQNITWDQLDELDEAAYFRLKKWLVSKDYHRNISGWKMSIGQMIEFLDEHNFVMLYRDGEGYSVKWTHRRTYDKYELCDALWPAVKEVLEK